MPHWIEAVIAYVKSPSHMAGMAVASAVLFAVSVLVLPWLIARMPPDYFSSRSARYADPLGRARRHPVWFVLRNVLGVVLLGSGIAMLFLPGQGLLTILAAVICLDFPGKRELERKIVARPSVLRALNAVRERAGRPPLDLGPPD